MFRLTHKIPKRVFIAVSGGADSMAGLDFLKFGRNVHVLHFNHNTENSNVAEDCVRSYCDKNNIGVTVGYLNKDIPKGRSKEDFWREQRYDFFNSFSRKPEFGRWENLYKIPIVTCHHLDDVAETWIFTSLNGESKLIPSTRGVYIRPFLTTRKSVFEEWADRKNIEYVYDSSNSDTKFMRNYIRHNLMPHAVEVNPGLHKVLKKKILSRLNK